jgi:hypothetical protein
LCFDFLNSDRAPDIFTSRSLLPSIFTAVYTASRYFTFPHEHPDTSLLKSFLLSSGHPLLPSSSRFELSIGVCWGLGGAISSCWIFSLEIHRRKSLSLSFALIFICTAKFDFYTARRGGAMKLGSCRGGAPSEEVSLTSLLLLFLFAQLSLIFILPGGEEP